MKTRFVKISYLLSKIMRERDRCFKISASTVLFECAVRVNANICV